MKSIRNIVEQYYITSINQLANEVRVLEEAENQNIKLKKIERVILIGELFSKSIQSFKNEGYKIEYADPTKLEYKIEPKSGNIHINSEGKNIVLSSKDSSNTVILMRSGYSDRNICFLLNQIENLGITVLNSADPVIVSSDKFSTAELLSQNGIPQPKYVLVKHEDCNKEDHDSLVKKLKTLYNKVDDDTKFVCKILNGHGGKGVFLCRFSNIVSILQCIFALDKERKILVQDFHKVKDGDIRVNVVTINGKQEIFDISMREKHSSDFRTNLSLGNTINNDVKLTKEQEEICLKAAKASGLIWAGVDLFPTKEGKNLVIEINGAPGPMSNIDDEENEKINHDFYTKLFETINKLC